MNDFYFDWDVEEEDIHEDPNTTGFEWRSVKEEAYALLTAMAHLLSNPVFWIRGAMARREDGSPAEADDPGAVCWCQEGAFRLLAGKLGISTMGRVEAGMALNYGSKGAHPIHVNDEQGYPATMRMINRAQRYAKRRYYDEPRGSRR